MTGVCTKPETDVLHWRASPFNSAHPEMEYFWMELSAVSRQQSGKTLFLVFFAESRKLKADRASP
jgi:hypothetical protein